MPNHHYARREDRSDSNVTKHAKPFLLLLAFASKPFPQLSFLPAGLRLQAVL
jgi:hypothetical protein